MKAHRICVVAVIAVAAALGTAARAHAAPSHPLILIPGTTGSYLGTNADGLIWLDATKLNNSQSDSFLDPLRLDPSGNDPASDPDQVVHVLHNYGLDGVVGPVQGCGGPFNKVCEHADDFYNITVGLLEQHGYTWDPSDASRDQTLFLFAYDWRRSAASNAAALKADIARIRELTGVDTVDILAHSQGGLVLNAYLHRYGGDDVHRASTIATPYLGTPKFLGILQFGEPCQVLHNGACLLNRGEAQKLVQNWPGALELLPSPKYWDVAASPLVERVRFADGSSTRQVETYDGMLSRLAASNRNMTLIGDAGDAHAQLDSFPEDSTPILRFAGVGLPTINRIEEEAYQDCLRLSNGFQTFVACRWRTRLKNHYASGDKTVVKQSAEVENCKTGIALDASSFARVAERPNLSHEALAQDPATISEAVRFLETGEAPPPPCPVGGRTVAARLDGAPVDLGFSGSVLRTTGGLVGSISDGTNVTGDIGDGFGVNEIGSSVYSPSDDAVDYATTNDATLEGTFIASSAGQVSLQFARYDADGVAALAVSPPLSVQSGAILTLAYGQPQDLSVAQVQVDDNGDGIVDRRVPFEQPIGSPGADDATPPTSAAHIDHFVENGQKLVRITVDAGDEGGAGVGDIHWWTTTGLEGTYTQPFVLPAQGDLEVVATDRAGNVQIDPAWGVLDDHTGIDFLVTDFLSPHVNQIGYMDYAGDVDYWGVHVDGGRVKFQLVGLTFDANLELDNLDGSAIAASTNAGNKSEKIDVTLAPGNYLLRVMGSGAAYSADHPYRLNVNELGG
jgi:pimeloyl-ACP methyl ester carboxylesterase